jgi:hypothetical protein
MLRDRPLSACRAAGTRLLVGVLALSAVLLFTSAAAAQQQPGSALPSPRLLTVFPPGGKAGSTVDVTITGTDLEEGTALLFSNPGIKGEPIGPPAPPADPKKPQPNTQAKPTATQFKITIPAETPLGIHDVRFVGKWGVSNPRAFVVGDLPEVVEKEPNNDENQAQKVPLNCTVNGTIANPTDVDYYQFTGSKGQRVVLSCLALSIDSRLQAAVEVFEAKPDGRQLAGNTRYHGNRHYHNNDALTDVTLPADGDYLVRVFNFTYTQGTPEHFYRLSISTAPWIDAIHPCVVEPGKPATLTVYGRNLPGGKPDPATEVDGRVLEKLTVTVNVPNDPAALTRLNYSGWLPPYASGLDGFEYRVRNATGSSNPFLLTYARAPVIVEKESHATPETAQEITLPCEIAGRIEKKRDRDWYSFTAKKGDVYNIEVISDRIGAPTDMYFVLRNPATKSDIIEVDENQDTFSLKFFARTDDPAVYRFTVPADGQYQLLVASRLGDTVADTRHLYRVRITPDHPDFRLVVLPPDYHRPDGSVIDQGGNLALTVLAWRQDGFNGDIALSAEGLPKGVTCVPQSLAAGLRHATLVLTAAADAPLGLAGIKIKGTATIKGQPVVREARPGTTTWAVQPQQNIPTISRLDRELLLAVRDKPPFTLTATIDKATLAQGDKATIDVKLARLAPDFKNPVTVAAYEQANTQPPAVPQGLLLNNNQPLTIAADKTDGKFTVVVNANTPPGTYNLVLRGTAQVPFKKDPNQKQPPQPLNTVLPSTPVTVTVLPKDLATVTTAVSNGNPKVGTQTEVVVRLVRKFDYSGEFKAQLVVPPAAKGISADEVTIPEGATEAKLVIKVAADAAPGARNELIVRTTAMYGTTAVVQESPKFNINVVK